MKRLLGTLIGLLVCAYVTAQVPFFGTSPGKNHIYSYSQVEFVPGSNIQGYFIFTHYGITDRFSAGVEFLGGTGFSLQGYNLTYQFVKQKYMNLSIQTSTRMNLLDNYKFDHQNISMFINGNITPAMGYVTNTYTNVDRDGKWSAYQFWYLSYSLGRFTPFVGMTNYWIGDFSPDLTVALAVNLGKVNLYAWSGYLFSGHPQLTIGFDYLFSCGE